MSDNGLAMVADYLDGMLCDAEVDRLEQWLEGDDAHVEHFVREVYLHRQFRDVLLGDARFREELVVGNVEEVSHLARHLRDRSHPRVAFWVAVTSLTVVFLAALVLLVGRRWPHSETAQSASEPLPPIVARITGQHECRWAKDSWRPQPSGHLRRDCDLHLTAGLVEITYDTGTRLILEGPAKYRVDDRNAGALGLGKLAARVPRRAVGFCVETPSATITDRGTEFGVEVTADGVTSVAVFQGEVDVAGGATGRSSRAAERLTAGQAARIAQFDTLVQRIPAESVEFSREILQGVRKTRILATKPLLYLPFDEPAEARSLEVLGSQEAFGRIEGMVSNGWHGVSGHDDDRAVKFDGQGSHVVLDDTEMLGLEKGFSVAAWVWVPQMSTGVRRLMANCGSTNDGTTRGIGLAVDAEDVVAGQGHRRLMFTLYGQVDVYSVPAVAPRRWTHVAAVVEPGRPITLYLDGQSVDTTLLGVRDHFDLVRASSPQAIRIGAFSGSEPWAGLADELLLYDRPLTAREVQEIYRPILKN